MAAAVFFRSSRFRLLESGFVIKNKVYVHAFQRVVGVQRAKPLVASAKAKHLKLTAPSIVAIAKYL